MAVLRRSWILLALLAGACTTAGISGREQESQVSAELARCRDQATSAGGLQACTAKSGPQLAALARGAFEDARTRTERADRIAYFAFAAQAGWESADPGGLEIADAAAEAGGAECAQSGAGAPRPPRDCALLAMAPGFVAHVRAVNLANRLGSQPPEALGAEDRRQLSETSRAYVRRSFDFVEAERKRFERDRTTPKPLLEFLSRQRAVFFCTATQLAQLSQAAGDDETQRAVTADQVRMRTAVPALRRQICAA